MRKESNHASRRGELGLVTAAETICSGIVLGLYQSRNVNSDGALGWDPDFPAEHAFFVVTELFQSCQALANTSDRERICSSLADYAPEWKASFQRADQKTRGA